MTTLERAKRFFRRIDHWSMGHSFQPPGPFTGSYDEFTQWTLPRLWCQYRVYRALLKRKRYAHMRSAVEARGRDAEEEGIVKGLDYALKLLDAVHGIGGKG